ncbi:putative FAD dependent oxidoreductase, FAD/NAD(P)-binding domain superfamily [Helianthus annuus]|nr:glycine oxidase isoform X1 [Helianthus annuus]KAJ0567320.1 putative FAD dependent oxidoreductase, FAD/NAD(P)-binding domain superfamily [Helianthus annuus]KAJ0912310.1 putative FAD dependent oxidoreductase, FAD/NAD(P)-binding domain superfamily [Helianthus annuus]
MVSISLSLSPNPNHLLNETVFSSHFIHRIATVSTLSGRHMIDRTSLSTSPVNYRREKVAAVRTVSDSHSYDVVVVGAGIIGLSIARQLLNGSDLSVAVVDAAVPCSGATGAGQGYIWMVNKVPGSEKWELVMRSRQLWEKFAEDVKYLGMDPQEVLGWKKTGSLLVGKTSQEMAALKEKVEQLSKAGLKAELLSSTELQDLEPALVIGEEGGAAFLPDDYQLDARRSVAYIEKENRKYATEGRYGEYYNQPLTGLLRSGNGKIEAVQTSKNLLYSKKAIVIATGCWTGSLMQELIRDFGIEFEVPVKPRKGHLLVIENFSSFKLNHGSMEVGYLGHRDANETSSISMTATMDTSGNLVLGSSRQFVGFSTEISKHIINQIWERAGEFFPSLRELSLTDLEKTREVRVGLRPFMPGGKPMIGLVPGLSNAFLAAGHEGEGLTLALGTAEMVADMVLGNPPKVDNAPYALHTLSS